MRRRHPLPSISHKIQQRSFSCLSVNHRIMDEKTAVASPQQAAGPGAENVRNSYVSVTRRDGACEIPWLLYHRRSQRQFKVVLWRALSVCARRAIAQSAVTTQHPKTWMGSPSTVDV